MTNTRANIVRMRDMEVVNVSKGVCYPNPILRLTQPALKIDRRVDSLFVIASPNASHRPQATFIIVNRDSAKHIHSHDAHEAYATHGFRRGQTRHSDFQEELVDGCVSAHSADWKPDQTDGHIQWNLTRRKTNLIPHRASFHRQNPPSMTMFLIFRLLRRVSQPLQYTMHLTEIRALSSPFLHPLSTRRHPIPRQHYHPSHRALHLSFSSA